MSLKLLALFLLLCLNLTVTAEMRRFQNADETKSFYAELTGYDTSTEIVTVRLKAGQTQSFKLNILSKDDQTYIKENGNRLGVGSNIRITLKRFQGKSEKKLEPRTVNRVSPSGYTITLYNRSKSRYSDITINYTLYYAVQDYVSPKRTHKEEKGTLECKKIMSKETVYLKTDTVDIVSGKLEPLISYKTQKNQNGQSYQEVHVDEPGGRRKDQLTGCKVELLIDGEVVKSELDGTLSLKQ